MAPDGSISQSASDPLGQAEIGDVGLNLPTKFGHRSRMLAGFRSRWRMPRWWA